MTGDSSATGTVNPAEARASVLITITTSGAETPICRLANSEELIRGLTVRDLIQRIISPRSLFSVGVPMSQLEAESATALAIGELLSADSCEVVTAGKGTAGDQNVSLDQSVQGVAREQVGTQGNKFVNINLEVRSKADTVAPSGTERRQTQKPPTFEVEPKAPAAKRDVFDTASPPSSQDQATTPSSDAVFERPASDVHPTGSEASALSVASEKEEPESASSETGPELMAADAATASVVPVGEEVPEAASAAVGELTAKEGVVGAEAPAHTAQDAEAEPPSTERAARAEAGSSPVASTGGIVTIVAENPRDEPTQEKGERKEYVRKSDWLRAQFLPEIEALDFSGLFVGNLGPGMREEKGRRNVMLADPSRITEVLLRANGYRRSGDHARALICYQELVDMDPSNADFRFLLGTTLKELGQREQASEAFMRAKELGHDGADKELEGLKRSGHRPKTALGFLRFWKQ